MTICICQHEERHHDNEAGKCDKIGCYCELFRPDMEDYTDIKFGPLEDKALPAEWPGEAIPLGESPIEGYSEEEIDRWIGRQYQEQAAQLAALQAENTRFREALQQIAAGNPAPPGGKWLSDAKMAQIARRALGNQT